MDNVSNVTGEYLKEIRDRLGLTQCELADKLSLSRTAIVNMERGRREISSYVSKEVSKLANDPFFAMENSYQYTGWGIPRLDGPAADMHRTNVFEKVHEELEEALEAMQKVKITVKPEFVKDFDRVDIEKSAAEHIDVIVASMTYVTTICQLYGFSWNKFWDDYRKKMIQKGYTKTG